VVTTIACPTSCSARGAMKYWLRRPVGVDPTCGFYLPAETIGPFTSDELKKLVFKSGRYTGECFYRSSESKVWVPLRCFAQFEWGEKDQLDRFREAGIRHVRWLASAVGGECEACASLDSKIFRLPDAPEVPPPDCRCDPWCGCVLIAIADDEADSSMCSA
jgi:hypothetical protein